MAFRLPLLCLLCLAASGVAELEDESSLIQMGKVSAKAANLVATQEKGCLNEGAVMKTEGDLEEMDCLLKKTTTTTEQIMMVTGLTIANMDFISPDLPYGFMTNKSADVWVPPGLEHNAEGLRHMNLVNNFKEGTCLRTHGMEHFTSALRRQMLAILYGKKVPTIADPFEPAVKLWMDKKITQVDLQNLYQLYENSGAPLKLLNVEKTCVDIIDAMTKEQSPLLKEAKEIDSKFTEVARMMRQVNVTCQAVQGDMNMVMDRSFKDGASFSPTEYGNAISGAASKFRVHVKNLESIKAPWTEAVELFLKVARPMFFKGKETAEAKAATEALILVVEEEAKAMPQKYLDSVMSIADLAEKVKTMA